MNNNNNQNQSTKGNQQPANQNAPKKNPTATIVGVVIVILIIIAVAVGFGKGNSGSMSGMSSTTMPDAMDDMATSTVPAPSAASTSTIPSSISNGTSTIGVALTKVPFIYVISTDKKVYTQKDQINMTISVVNNTSASSTFSFPSGCEGNYTVAGFDLSKHIVCTPGPASFTIAPHHEGDIPLAFYTSVATLPVGTWPLYASVIGYGGATTTVTITK